MAVPSLSGLLELWVPWLLPGSFLGAFWEPHGESWVPLGSLLGAELILNTMAWTCHKVPKNSPISFKKYKGEKAKNKIHN